MYTRRERSMAVRLTVSVVLLATTIVTFLTDHSVSGEYCRFASRSTSQGSCIFPCRCTDGCNTTTGDCLNGGQCEDGHPSGYRWSGTACQTGNVAFRKTASQSTATQVDAYPAERAVDGRIGPTTSYQHCSIPDIEQTTNTWWMVDLGGTYRISRVTINSRNINCKPGYFGWRCRFKCSCRSGEICDDVTGQCPSSCPGERWGVGCLLSSDCTYHDPKGHRYDGRKTRNDQDRTCIYWTQQRSYYTNPDTRGAARNFCRNPIDDEKPWCYHNTQKQWDWCTFRPCQCVTGRFDVNCKKECHCSSGTEDCQASSGRCTSGCAPHFTGPTCQECKNGYFGEFCEGTCHCNTGSCDKKRGRCPRGCAPGWTGDNCQTDMQHLPTFTLSVGNIPNIVEHTKCASHNGEVAAGETVSKSCTAVGRYLTFRRSQGSKFRLIALCEVAVIGHRYMSCQDCPTTSACNDVIGCDACAPGKQQPHCKKDCEKGYYGINCKETCGRCKAKSECSIADGNCASGCQIWYSTNVCKTYIAIPNFQPSDIPSVDDVTHSSAVASWSKAGNIPPGVDSHYYYVLRWRVEGETKENTTRVVQPVDNIRIEAKITGLVFNRNYSVSVEPYRQDSGQQEGGIATGVTTFKTSCIGPHPTVIEYEIQSSDIVVRWKAITESGCDNVVAVRVWYQRQTSNTWKYVEPDNVNQTDVTISDLSRDVYILKLTATNNENITSTSPSVTASLVIAATTTVDSPDMKQMTNSGLSKGAYAGIAVAVIIVIVVVVVVLLVVVRRRNVGSESGSTPNIAINFLNRVRKGSEKDNVAFKAAEEEDEADEEGDDEDPDNGLMLNHDEETGVIYANTQQMSRSVATGDLAAYVKDKRRHDGFTKEHEDLPSGVRAKCEAAKKSQNKSQNRFVNILAYDHTRVVLSVSSGQRDYINASYIMGYKDKANAYIACQGPRDWTIEDMWRMVWQEKSNTIVMLTNLYEMGKEKCNQYWPEEGEVKSWGNFITEASTEDRFADYVIREFSLKNEETMKMRKIRQLHFTAWPDKGTPEYAYPLLAFHRKVNSFDSVRHGPLVVHCSAGVGRTGTFIAIDILIQQAAAEGKVDVFQCVNLLRTQRMDMVQTVSQYVYVHQALIESGEVTVIPSSQLRQTFDELGRGNKLAGQFERLNALKPLAKKAQCAALEPSNVEKNRIMEIIPSDRHRPYLVTPWKEGNNYINAVVVHGYKKQDAFILTQSPMTTTVVDLWRLLYDHESRTVVMLDDNDVTDDQCVIYWPSKKAIKQQYGPLQVELVETNFSENSNVTEREFKLTKSGRSGDCSKIVKQFQLKNNGWHHDASLPADKMVLLNLLDMVEKWQQQSGNGRITIHCSDGASRCGLLCAASYVLEHLKVEQEVDIFHAVQHIRTTRPQLVTDLDQYRFLFEVALAYMSQFDTYANFQ